MSIPRILSAAATLMGVAGLALAASHGGEPPREVEARDGLMNILSINLGVIGNMARGNTDYDAEAAEAAADNLVAVSGLDLLHLFPEGTSSEDIEGVRALPAIWENQSDFASKWDAFGQAASGMQQAAGGGLESLQAAMGPLGGSCGGCHDDYRMAEN